MRALTTLLILLAVPAASFAQTPRGYANLAGGFAVTSDNTSGDVVGEAGVRVAPNLFVFGNLGRFENVAPSAFQQTVDATSASLATGGLGVTGTARVPAWYTMGGVRWIVPTSTRIAPYVFGGAGLAHVTDTATFTYSSGTLAGATPISGDDVTQQLVSLGDYVQPASSNAFMLSFGGGVQAPVAPRLVFDVGYRVSRIGTDTPFNAQSVTFGFGYKF
jgi:opacity protein-like surface antigen